VTVIAYSTKTRIMAADSRCSNENMMHLTNCRKIFRLENGALLGTSGDSDDRDVRVLLAKATPRNMPSRSALAALKCCFHGIMVFPKGQVFLVCIDWYEHEAEGEWMAGVDPITDEIIAIGHGMEYAYGVLEHGGTPLEAVRCACKRDTTCALPIQWESLDGDRKSADTPEIPAPAAPPVAPVVAKPKRKK